MENGLVEIVFSAASCSLAFPAMIYLAREGTRRATVLLGVVLASALLSGQGYMQIGLLVAVLPAGLVLLVQPDLRLHRHWQAFFWAGLLAAVLTAYYWLPFLHFFPNFAKPTDHDFGSTQALAHLPLNLVIGDHDFYYSDSLHKLAWPHLYANYIGWVPVLLAGLAVRLIPREGRRLLLFFAAAVGLVYLAASAVTFEALHRLGGPLADLSSSIRFPSEISSLAVPPLLALAAWGLDRLLQQRWPRLHLTFPSGLALGLSAAWLLALPLAGAVRSAYDFGKGWLSTYPVPEDYFRLVPPLKPAETAWVEPPFGDWTFTVVALQNGMKVTNTYRPWTWREAAPPPPRLLASRDAIDPSTPGYLGQREYLSLVEYPFTHYAYVEAGATVYPCAATALGGNIDVTCANDVPGRLVVREKWWTGWGVTLDGARARLAPGEWLSLEAPAGRHVYQFRYRPWDVVIGLLITLAGLAWAWRWWVPAAQAAAQPAPARS
jgi:hypothetical protein